MIDQILVVPVANGDPDLYVRRLPNGLISLSNPALLTSEAAQRLGRSLLDMAAPTANQVTDGKSREITEMDVLLAQTRQMIDKRVAELTQVVTNAWLGNERATGEAARQEAVQMDRPIPTMPSPARRSYDDAPGTEAIEGPR